MRNKMISFTIINEENKEELLDKLLLKMPEADGDYASEIIDSLLEDDGCEYAVSSSDGCLLVRIFDEKYLFLYPVALSEEADESLAAFAIREYAVKEEIPLIYTDVPSIELGNLIPLFRHVNVDALDKDGECFTVRVMSEVGMLDEIPSIEFEGIRLDEITEADDSLYAILCKDKDTNALWGYDYSADNDSPDDSYFREMAENEFSRGVAMAFAVRVNGEFVGEASIYALDLLGGAECAIRILPQYRGRGIATEAISAIKYIAEKIGLKKLCATVDEQNEASKRLFSKSFDECRKENKKYKYYCNL
jgi:RimJ/RimL family protein N-acetyltransferase